MDKIDGTPTEFENVGTQKLKIGALFAIPAAIALGTGFTLMSNGVTPGVALAASSAVAIITTGIEMIPFAISDRIQQHTEENSGHSLNFKID